MHNMRRWVYYVAVLTVFAGKTQNLIFNGSFEEGQCPTQHSVKPQHFQVDGWWAADESTPDYYHVCAKEIATIPTNWAGSQYPVDGDGYVGIYLRKGKYQENLATRLIEPLEKGVKYKVSFSIANVSNASHFANEIAVLIARDSLRLSHLKNYDHRQITLPIPAPEEFMDFSWEHFSFTYEAQGGERFFYIGPLQNPNTLGSPNTYRIMKEPMLNYAMYVYVDNVRLENEQKSPPPDPPTFELAEELDPVSIYFAFDEHYLQDEASTGLDTLRGFIQANDLHLLITGGTDSLGTTFYNQELGMRRALAVKDYLSFAGVEEGRIEAVSKGEQTPEYANHSEEYRRLNRNALIEFYRKE